MTKRDFFVILIKCLGLFVLADFMLNNFPFSVSYSQDNAYIVVVQMAIVLIYLGIIINAPKVVSALRLTRGIDIDTISIDGTSIKNFVQMALILIGTYLFLYNFIDLIINSAWFLVDKIENKIGPNQALWHPNPIFFSSIVKSIIGFLVMSKSGWLSNLLHKDKD